MPSVGSILLTLQARTDQLERDLKKAQEKVREFGSRTKGVMETLGVSGETLKRSFGNVATGVLMMTNAFDDAGKVGKVLEQSLGAFMVGGPLGAGVALVSGAFKLLADDTKDAGIAAEESRKAYKKYFEDLTKRAEEAQRAVQDLDDKFRDLQAGTEPGFHAKLRDRDSVQKMLAEAEIALEGARRARDLNERRKELDARGLSGFAVHGTEERKAQLAALNEELQRIERFAGPRGQDNEIQKRFEDAAEAVDKLRSALRSLAESDLLSGKIAGLEAAKASAPGAATSAWGFGGLDRMLAGGGLGGGAPKQAAADGRAAVAAVGDAWHAVTRAVDAYAEKIRRANDLVEKQKETADELVRRYQAQADIAGTVGEAEKARKEILEDIRQLVSGGSILQTDSSRVFDAMWGAWQAKQATAAAAVSKTVGQAAGESFTESFSTTVQAADSLFVDLGQAAGSTLVNALAEAVFGNGFRLEEAVQSVLKMVFTRTLSDVVNLGLGALFGGGGAAGGGGGVGALISAGASLFGGALGGGGGGGGNYAPAHGGGGVLAGPPACPT